MKLFIDLLLAAAMLCFMGMAGYFFVKKMTDLIEIETEDQPDKKRKICDVVIFGDNPFARGCEEYLNAKGICCLRIAGMEQRRFRDIRRAGYVVALDDSDYQNLVACGVLQGCCHSSQSAAVCNDGSNRNIYLENKIRILDPARLSEESVYQMVKENRYAS